MLFPLIVSIQGMGGAPLDIGDRYIPSLTTCLKDHVSQDDSKSSIIDKIILLKYNILIENQLTA